MIQIRKTLYSRKKSGFTLVEIIVSLAVFSIVMTVGVGSLLALVDANKKARALQSVMNNLNFALENMSRTVRVGTTYHCSTSSSPPPNPDTVQDCPSGGALLALEGSGGDTDTSSDQIVYRINGSQLEKSSNGGSTFVGITAPEVTIESFNFYVTGAEIAGDNSQPRVVMILQGSAGVSDKIKTNFNIQATVSQRLLDL